jgi:hypothetical protein
MAHVEFEISSDGGAEVLDVVKTVSRMIGVLFLFVFGRVRP